MSVPSTPTHLEAEIRTQPEDWLAAAGTARRHAAQLPAPGERVAVVGCGTSLHMAMAYAVARESAGAGVTDAFTPTELPVDRGYDRIIAITRSGTTTEIIELLERLGGRVPATVITGTPDTAVLDLAEPILTPEVDEQSVVQTRFATTTLAMLRWSLGEDLGPVAAEAAAVIADPALPSPVLSAEQLTFVGRGWSIGIAHEAALKLRESALLWTESYPMMEYRHGPMSISAPGRVVWAIGDPVVGLADSVRPTGADFVHHAIDPLAELVRIHLLCLSRAADQGLDPDQPRNLTRSIVLP